MKIWTIAPAALLAWSMLGLSACSQYPDLYARYEPSGPGDVWVQGTRLHLAKTEGTRPTLAFTSGFVGKTMDFVSYDTSSTRPLRFSMKVANAGDTAILIEPARFRLWSPESSWAYPCLDPEKVIRSAENSMRQEKDNYAATQGMDALLTLPVLVATGASKKTPEQAEKEDKFWKDKEEVDAREEETHLRSLARSDAVLRDWSELSLRRTTLFPGKEVNGLVSFIDDFPYHRPDSLELQYEISPGRFLGLGRYGKVVDSAAIRKRDEERKKRRNRPEPTRPF